MLTLKSTQMRQDAIGRPEVEAVYAVRHCSEDFDTTLELDLKMVMDPNTGKVKATLVFEEVEQPDFDAATEKLAVWCERMAQALRAPRQVVAHVPMFEQVWP